MSKKEQFADIDDESKAVFTEKGYQLMGKLGECAFGLVYKAKNFKKNDQLCAVKVKDINKMSPKLRDEFGRKLGALLEVKHPNCVRMYDFIDNEMSQKKVYIFMEYAGNGDLSGYVKKHKILKEELARSWFKQTSEAVAYLHNEMKMAHRDIKLDNILLDENNQAKLTGFGCVYIMTNEDSDDEDISQLVSEETFCGTVSYYSPQLVAKKPYSPFKADVWAMGVVLYAMLCNRLPFHNTDKLYKEQTDYPAYIKSRFLDSVSATARNLLLKLFDPNEKTRPMMSEVLEHQFYAQ